MNKTMSLAALAVATALALPGVAFAQRAGDSRWQHQDGRGPWGQGSEPYRMHERDGRHDEGYGRYDERRRYGVRGYGYQHYRQPRVVVQRQVVVRPQPVYPAGYGYGNAYYGTAYGNPYGAYNPWQVGGYSSGNGYAPTYVVNDYNTYGLYAPPRGYAWRRDDFGHYMLVALASGLISQLIMGR